MNEGVRSASLDPEYKDILMRDPGDRVNDILTCNLREITPSDLPAAQELMR